MLGQNGGRGAAHGEVNSLASRVRTRHGASHRRIHRRTPIPARHHHLPSEQRAASQPGSGGCSRSFARALARGRGNPSVSSGPPCKAAWPLDTVVDAIAPGVRRRGLAVSRVRGTHGTARCGDSPADDEQGAVWSLWDRARATCCGDGGSDGVSGCATARGWCAPKSAGARFRGWRRRKPRGIGSKREGGGRVRRGARRCCRIQRCRETFMAAIRHDLLVDAYVTELGWVDCGVSPG